MSNPRSAILRRVAGCLAAFMMFAMPASAQNAALVGLDRIEKASPWTAVGRLDMQDGGFCTATLIATDLVLTAAHCTFDPDTHRARSPRELTFRAGFRNGLAQSERRVIQIARPDSYVSDDDSTARHISADVALLRLARPIGSHIIAPFSVYDGKLGQGPVSVVSYGQGREEIPSLQRECQVLAGPRSLVVMDCDVTFGSSGAPVFRREGERVRIASIISGTAIMDGERRTFGMALPETLTQLKAKMHAAGPAPVAKVRRIEVGGGKSGLGAKFVSANGS